LVDEAMAGAVPGIVVLALGAGALGGPDGLRLLLAVAGRNPVADIAICLFALTAATAQILGAVLLARFVRKAPAGAGADPLALGKKWGAPLAHGRSRAHPAPMSFL